MEENDTFLREFSCHEVCPKYMKCTLHLLEILICINRFAHGWTGSERRNKSTMFLLWRQYIGRCCAELKRVVEHSSKFMKTDTEMYMIEIYSRLFYQVQTIWLNTRIIQRSLMSSTAPEVRLDYPSNLFWS